MHGSRWFGSGAVATPHHLASAAGATVLDDGGNAVDAAIAASLVLAVVTPYHCGAGGDLLAIVHDGAATGVVSAGAMPAGATPAAIQAAIAEGHGGGPTLPGTDGMPAVGALPVTVPGAVAGWYHLLTRWGSRSFGDLAAAAITLAEEGFSVSAHGAAHVDRARPVLGHQPGWSAAFGSMSAERRFVHRDLAGALRHLADDGPDALYRGPIGAAAVETLQAGGATMTAADLADHRVEEVAPLQGRFRDRDVLQLPPPTQGVTALTALGILDRLPRRAGLDPALAAHHEVEAVRLALRDRQHHLADPRSMRVTTTELLGGERLDGLTAGIADDRAATVDLGRPAPGGTAYLCAGDGDGLVVSLIQSNFRGFGSGMVVPGFGIGLHNRGAHLRLAPADPSGPNVVAPGIRPLHTLIPAMMLRDGVPEVVFGTMGGDGQAQVHAQLLRRWVDSGQSLQAGVDAPRFVVDLADGAVVVESRTPAAVVDGLRARGHEVRVIDAYDHAGDRVRVRGRDRPAL
jgi:gamma-glutamyltranspeptidase/glutathione hydrolase